MASTGSSSGSSNGSEKPHAPHLKDHAAMHKKLREGYLHTCKRVGVAGPPPFYRYGYLWFNIF